MATAWPAGRPFIGKLSFTEHHSDYKNSIIEKCHYTRVKTKTGVSDPVSDLFIQQTLTENLVHNQYRAGREALC